MLRERGVDRQNYVPLTTIEYEMLEVLSGMPVGL